MHTCFHALCAVVTKWVYTTQQVVRDRGYNNQLGARLYALQSVAAYKVGGCTSPLCLLFPPVPAPVPVV